MALRDKINQNPGLIAGAVGVVVLLVIVLIVFTMRGEGGRLNGPRYRPDKDYFSDDEGHTYFIDDSNKIPPFQHNGRPAYRAAVFLDSNDKKFVGWLESYDPAVKDQLESEIKSGKAVAAVLGPVAPNVKKVNSGGWVKPKKDSVAQTPEYQRAMTATPPDKKATLKSARLPVSDADIEELSSH